MVNWSDEQGKAAPPISEETEREISQAEAEDVIDKADKARQGKVPLHPAAIRLPVAVSGRLAAELTGYNGWEFTESELKDLTEIWSQLEIKVSPASQAIVATTTMFAMKAASYLVWLRAGKPAEGAHVKPPE